VARECLNYLALHPLPSLWNGMRSTHMRGDAGEERESNHVMMNGQAGLAKRQVPRNISVKTQRNGK